MDLFELDAAGDALLCCAKRVVITMLRFNAKRNIIMASAALSLHYAAAGSGWSKQRVRTART